MHIGMRPPITSSFASTSSTQVTQSSLSHFSTLETVTPGIDMAYTHSLVLTTSGASSYIYTGPPLSSSSLSTAFTQGSESLPLLTSVLETVTSGRDLAYLPCHLFSICSEYFVFLSPTGPPISSSFVSLRVMSSSVITGINNTASYSSCLPMLSQ